MANVATIAGEGTTRLAVTKLIDGTRYVSCTCCETGEECCVYPGSCSLGPPSILFYGETISGDGDTYGDTTNGVIRESGVWAVYRNGVRTTRNCLGMAVGVNGGPNPEAPLNVGANLANSYAVEIQVESSPVNFSGTLNFNGVLAPDSFGNDLYQENVGQCVWNAGSGGNQSFDEGVSLVFSPATCRWELTTGPIFSSYGYLASGSPVGSYTPYDPQAYEYIVVS